MILFKWLAMGVFQKKRYLLPTVCALLQTHKYTYQRNPEFIWRW